ncbi:hypothetical protein LCGC14_0972670 [marine sediment metagenome]|uniref:Uncharacterized protein n=1 Tax=marine sediment metagenome TaxID=412755 RepID=A0A0F9NXG2_9ZZZZ
MPDTSNSRLLRQRGAGKRHVARSAGRGFGTKPGPGPGRAWLLGAVVGHRFRHERSDSEYLQVSLANSHGSHPHRRSNSSSKFGGNSYETVRCLFATEQLHCQRIASNAGGPRTNPIKLAQPPKKDLLVRCGSSCCRAEHGWKHAFSFQLSAGVDGCHAEAAEVLEPSKRQRLSDGRTERDPLCETWLCCRKDLDAEKAGAAMEESKATPEIKRKLDGQRKPWGKTHRQRAAKALSFTPSQRNEQRPQRAIAAGEEKRGVAPSAARMPRFSSHLSAASGECGCCEWSVLACERSVARKGWWAGFRLIVSHYILRQVDLTLRICLACFDVT